MAFNHIISITVPLSGNGGATARKMSVYFKHVLQIDAKNSQKPPVAFLI